jgi:hypothetical protein
LAGERRIRLADDVVYRSFGSETVVLNLKTGQYHGLRGSAGRMLELLCETEDPAETARRIAREQSHPLPDVERDLAELCQALAERALLVWEDRPR